MKRFLSLILALVMCASLFVFAEAEDGYNAVNCKITNLGILTSKIITVGGGYDYARSVWDITAYEGRIYIGSGDYNTNSGSHYGRSNIWCYLPSSGKWDMEKNVPEEAINRFRLIDGDLCFVGMDAMSNSQYENYFRYNRATKKWATKHVLPNFVMHNFDLLQSSDGTVFAGLGTNDGDCDSMAVSYDGGETFVNVPFRRDGHVLVDSDVTDGGKYPKEIYCRTYNVFEYKGNVYATWVAYCETSAGTALCNSLNSKFSGLYIWNKEERVFDFYCGDCPYNMLRDGFATGFKVIFNDKLIFVKNYPFIMSDDLKSYTVSASSQFGTATCARVAGGLLYISFYKYDDSAKTYVNKLYSTYDLENFREVCSFEFSSPVSSFCLSDGYIYAGTGGQNTAEARPTLGTVFRIDTGRFSDVKPGKWYNSAVDYVCDNSLMSGTSKTTFSPELASSRAMLVKVLFNNEKGLEISGENPFADVPEGEWYTDAVKWAYENKIVAGKTETEFAPNESITREQFASILYRYALYKGYDVSAKSDSMEKFSDYKSSSDYAKPALSWANAKGYITGMSETVLSPRTGATRAQMASILKRFKTDNPE